MKKVLLTLTIILSLCGINNINANTVDPAFAKTIAKNYFHHFGMKQITNLSLAYTETDQNELPVYFVFNVNQSDGFIIVSGEDAATPVLGYSLHGQYSTTNLAPNFVKWMQGYRNQILYIRENNLQASNEIATNWTNYSNNVFNNAKSITTVNPLCTTTWDQGNQAGFYNAQCPVDGSLPDQNNNSTRCVTGCAATAMAQIMKFWNFPATGSGIHSYNATNYGTLTANFGSTTYNWGNMPNNVTSTNNDVATLMYQCGVSVEMNYGPDGSGAYVITADNPVCSQSAYTTYFGYDPSTIQGLYRSNYNDAAWDALLEADLNAGHPIQYVGSGNSGGHTFVCDGYDANNYFDMNWGWSGSYDGFFALDALNPGTEDFNSNQEALTGIVPISGGNTQDIEVWSAITVTPNPINFDQSFTVNADIYNAGGSTFDGNACAAIFDLSGNFIGYVQTLTGLSLPSGYNYTGGLTFSNAGMLAVPGTYWVGIYYQPTNGNWYLAGSTYYTNPIQVTIAAPSNPLELYSAITPSPTTFVQGQTASVNVDILNNNSYTYTGEYQADLYDLSGNWVEEIGYYDETTGLPSGYDYLSPYITFTTPSITAAPGTYILAIVEQEQFTGPWYYVGGDYFTNPVLINVVAAGLNPDIYEVNNTQGTAYVFPIGWNGNTAYVETQGSNIHISTDIDFYQINLAAGYSYSITARADDSYSSDTTVTYTDDVIWAYDSGTGWSQFYDDIMTGSINVNGAGSVVFEVTPYFTGEIGTYLLKMMITRTPATGIETLSNDKNVSLYPNPNNGNFILSYQQLSPNSEFQIQDLTGRIVYDYNLTGTEGTRNIDVSNLSQGLYFYTVKSGDSIETHKLVITK